MSVEFSPDRAAFIGWIDEYHEEIFYFNNGSDNVLPVDLIINVCPEGRKLCDSKEDIIKIITYFCETGGRNPDFLWIADEMVS